MTNEKDWIDFNLIKQSVSMEMLIVYLGLYPLRRKGSEVRLRCPFHNGKSENSMLINLAQNTFYCFGCKCRGNVIDFVARFEDCSIKEAAFRLDDWFSINGQPAESREVPPDSSNGTETASPPLTAQHLIASIELQLAQLKKLLISR